MIKLKNTLIKIFTRLKLFPSIYFVTMPFKIYEYKKLINVSRRNKDDIILDLGCGFGTQTLCIGKKCKHIIGIDPDENAINYSKMLSTMKGNTVSSEFICGRLEEHKFPSNKFDKLFSFSVIEHIPNYQEVIDEVNRILTPGGKFIFSVDSLNNIHDKEIIDKHKREQQVVNYFSRTKLEEILTNAKFKNIHIEEIFKSNYSRSLFIEGINNRFKYGIKYLFSYAVLLIKEHFTTNDKGLFLIAMCEK